MKHLIKVILQKIKWKNKLSLAYTCNISMRSQFEGMNKIYPDSSFDGYMGKGSYIACNSHIYGKVGRYTSIAQNCTTIQGVHPYTYPYVSTSPMFISIMKQNGHTYVDTTKIEEVRYAGENFPIVIGNDCWIGAGVSIIGGITIGDGAVVLAGSVVSKNIPPYSIVGGVPAKVLRYRYSEEDVEFLLKFEWWNKDETWIRENVNLFTDFTEFRKKYDAQ